MDAYWLFQHEYHKRWIIYKEEANKVLNNAVQDKELSVTLPNKITNKELLVDFESMIQRNKKTLYEQRLRSLVFSSDYYYSWEWKNDKEEWCSYKPHLAALLEVSFSNGDKLVSYCDNEDYEVNLESLVMCNKNSLQVSPVRREKVDLSTSISIKPIQEMDVTELASLQLKKMSTKRKLTDANTSPAIDTSVPSTSRGIMDIETDSSFSADSDTIIHVDKECPEKESYHICIKEGTIFLATLNQTCMQKNNNKFYLIQLLEHNETKQYAVWKRWGRVGVRGQSEMNKFGHSFEEAKDAFVKKFYDKTYNSWSDHKNFVHVKGKYDLVQIELHSSPESKTKKPKKVTDGQSKLAPRLKALIEIISNKRLMEETMKDMAYDSNRTPLGKLTLKQVKEGYIALNKISEAMKDKGYKINLALVNACNEFYTKIPHSCGMKAPPLITTQFQLDNKLRMLEALSNINIALGVMGRVSASVEHPLDRYYLSLDCTLEELDFYSPEYKAFDKSLTSTHGPTHSSYTMEVVDLFKCHKEKEDTVFKDVKNNLLLWHGSRITNWIGILKEGLRIAPPEAPRTGYMFGKGIYFADVSSKSANYCYATKRENEGLLLLCEVSLGNVHQLYEANDELPARMPCGFDSVQGKGRITPSDFESGVLSSEAKIPCGPLIENPDHEGSLQYNEYIVYNVKQVKMKYLARVKFNFK